jgi:lipopolysaccharide export LptBFGC system permease protein LptF
MVAFLISILLALFIYYPVSLLGETFAKEGYCDPILAIWPGNIILACLGFFFIMRVMRR